MNLFPSHKRTSPAIDVIGDVHGHAAALYDLLNRLGYRRTDGAWRHPRNRVAVFTGDLIDKGPDPRGVLKTVSTMMRAGSARCVMGNHEFNALLHYTQGEDGTSLRRMTDRQLTAHEPTRRTLVRAFPDEWNKWLNWMRSLPLWISADNYRVVHACWDRTALAFLIEPVLKAAILAACGSEGPERRLVDTLLNGPVMAWPDNSGAAQPQRPIRLRWWASVDPGATLQDVSVDALPPEVANLPVSEAQATGWISYSSEAPLLFVGHYNRSGAGSLRLARNVICVDAGITSGGRLAAWRLHALPFFADRTAGGPFVESVSLAG